MVLVFASSFRENDPQRVFLQNALDEIGKESLFINPLKLADLCKLRLVLRAGLPVLFWGDEEVTLTSIFYSRLLRTDCLIDLPSDCFYPTMFRQKAEILLNEIDCSFGLLRRFPASLNEIRFGECKTGVYRLAQEFGLSIPFETISSFSRPEGERYYRKSLGFPFSVSFNRYEGREVAVTLENKQDMGDDLCGLFWQWQTYIELEKQTRSVVVGENVWTYSLDKDQLRGRSLRKASEDTNELLWREDKLPATIELNLIAFLKNLNLGYSAPEFVVDSQGQFILIDLNPCGDWFGFCNEKDAQEIAKAIAQKL